MWKALWKAWEQKDKKKKSSKGTSLASAEVMKQEGGNDDTEHLAALSLQVVTFKPA